MSGWLFLICSLLTTRQATNGSTAREFNVDWRKQTLGGCVLGFVKFYSTRVLMHLEIAAVYTLKSRVDVELFLLQVSGFGHGTSH
jgi:hypothetical protein